MISPMHQRLKKEHLHGTHDVLPSEELLSDDRGQATKHMPTGVDNDHLESQARENEATEKAAASR